MTTKSELTKSEAASEAKREKRLRDGTPALLAAAERLLMAVDRGKSLTDVEAAASLDKAVVDLRLAVTKIRYAETAN